MNNKSVIKPLRLQAITESPKFRTLSIEQQRALTGGHGGYVDPNG